MTDPPRWLIKPLVIAIYLHVVVVLVVEAVGSMVRRPRRVLSALRWALLLSLGLALEVAVRLRRRVHFRRRADLSFEPSA